MKLALGTVQFGLDYGISNTQGQVCSEEVKRILAFAKQHNITTLDTASAYGNSEEVLGKTGLSNQFDIVSKIPALNSAETDMAQYVKTSLQQLNVESLASVLFHHVDDIIASPYAQSRFDALVNLKEQGVINKIGVSVYTTEQLDFCLKHYPIDIVQLPLSCMDQRFVSSHWLDKLADKKVETHCRSIFLQGLLLMKPEELPSYFTPFKKYFQHFSDTAKQLKISTLSLALAIGSQHDSIDKVVVGCCNVKQLSEIISAYTAAQKINEDLSSLACENRDLIIPSNWH